MEIKDEDQKYIAGTYNRQNAFIVKGKGAVCEDENGKEYIDFGAGIGVNSLGYCDDEWSDAVCHQAKTLQHTSNLYYTEPAVRLAEKLHTATRYEKILFCNSGAEANECAIKLVRKYSFDKYGKDACRNKILCLRNSFHGRTVTTLSATGQDVFHNYFFPFTEGFEFANANDIADVKEKLSDRKFCAVMLEFIQGEGGVIPLELEFVQELFSFCAGHDVLVIADEVQTGMGRTGKILASENYKVKPNITTLAKGLGGGLPIGSVLMDKKTEDVFGFCDHGTTFGGNPVICAGALVALNRVSDENFLIDVRRKGEYLKQEISSLQEVDGVDSMGMMIGIRLKTKKAADVAAECLKNGLLVLTAKEKIRLLPPLSIKQDELNKGLFILKEVLKS